MARWYVAQGSRCLTLLHDAFGCLTMLLDASRGPTMPLFTMLIYLSVVSNMQAYSKEEATIPPIVFESARLCRSVCFSR